MYIVIPPPRIGKLKELEQIIAAMDQLAEALRRAFSVAMNEDPQEDAPDDDRPAVCAHCIPARPDLPKHQIPWFTTGFQ